MAQTDIQKRINKMVGFRGSQKEMETLLLWQERTHVLLMMQEEKLSQEVLVLMVDATRLALAVLLVIVKTSIVTFVPHLA